jgi:hypothetical protein
MVAPPARCAEPLTRALVGPSSLGDRDAIVAFGTSSSISPCQPSVGPGCRTVWARRGVESAASADVRADAGWRLQSGRDASEARTFEGGSRCQSLVRDQSAFTCGAETTAIIYTSDVHFDPGLIHAQVALTGVLGEGVNRAGIKGYWHRPEAGSADVFVDLGGWPSWRSIVGAIDQMTGVRWGIAVANDSEAWARLDIYWWS